MLFQHGVYANEGLDLDLAILKINKEVKSLNNEILSLKDEIELIKEEQRISSAKIAELLQIIELNLSNTKQEKKSTKKTQSNSAEKLYSDGKNEFLLGNYEKAITLFISFAKNSPNSSNLKNSKLWLARAYFESEKYLKAKDSFLDYQSNNQEHLKFADSMFELARVLDKLNEVSAAKLLLIDMIKQYPDHPLIDKANQLLLDL
ncbi:outer membrane protein assembly factor BamD [Candidatus Thioglobus sp.]|nr:outer membrane protein assembly factor BamD [Candidatus Thioglobus sp.]